MRSTIFRKARGNIAEKLKQIGQIQATPDCEEVLGTKIGRKFFRKITVLANGVKKSNASLNNEATFLISFLL